MRPFLRTASAWRVSRSLPCAGPGERVEAAGRKFHEQGSADTYHGCPLQLGRAGHPRSGLSSWRLRR
jgi:hypothetical protein